MWILPSKLKTSFLSAQGLEESSVDLNEQALMLSQSAMWRSKPSSAKTWFARCNKVHWLKRLSGRILKPSMHDLFVERFTASLEDIHVSLSVMPAQGTEQTTLDTFTRLFQDISRQQDLFGASLKTSKDTLPLDSQKYRQTYEVWVTQLRQESSLRKKLAHHISETGSLSLPSERTTWKTPCSSEMEGGTMRELRGDAKYKLRDQVMWLTPVSSDATMSKKDVSKLKLTDSGSYRLMNAQGTTSNAGLGNQVKMWATPKCQNANSPALHGQGGMDLQPMVLMKQNWPTPDCSDRRSDNSKQQGLSNMVKKIWPTHAARDVKGANGMEHFGKTDRPHLDQLPNAVMIAGLQDQESNNITGRGHVLSPAWVAQLMGTTIEKTLFVHLETA